MRKVVALLLLLVAVGCAKVPITGRKQSKLIPSGQILSMSAGAYQGFLDTNRVVPSSDARTQMVKRVGTRMSAAIEKWMNENGHAKRVEGFEWEFNLVDDQLVNAWCMPGGKIVFYTGILPITQDEEGMAVVMGHEIAHAIASHGNERMSQGLLLQGGGLTLAALLSEKPEEAQKIFLGAYGVAGTLGSLKYGRKHESEADKLGLVFMSLAGYDAEAAVDFWKRMAANGGAKPPEFLSTHPSDERRIADIEEFLPEAKTYFTPYSGK